MGQAVDRSSSPVAGPSGTRAADPDGTAADGVGTLALEIQRASALLDSLYDSTPIGLGFWDRDLRYVRVNEALAAINELPAEEHVGKTLHEVVPQLAHILEPIARGVLERREAVVALEIAAGTPSDPDAARYWRASYYPVLARDGTALGVGAIIEEVTDRRRAELRIDLQLAVTRLLAEAENPAEAVPLVLETIGDASGFDVGCYWPVDVDQPRRTWARAGLHAEGFLAMTERAPFAPPLLPAAVAQSGEPTWVEELESTRLARASVARAEGLRSGVALPVAVEGELLGVLELYSAAQRPRDAALLDTLVGLAGQLGQFLRRKRAENERTELLQRERQARADAESAVATLRKLGRVSEAALAHLSLADLLPALLTRIVEVLDADTAAILLLDDGKLYVRATVGLDEEVEQALAVPVGDGMAGRVAATRAPLLVHDLSTIELASPMLRARGVNSLVAIPLVVEDAVIGVVHAGSEAFAHFTDADARLLELIADRIALAINQAVLADAEHAAQERLRFLADVSTILAETLDVDLTLGRLGELVARRAADWCTIHLAEEPGARLVTVAHRDQALAAAARPALEALRPDPGATEGVGHVIRTGQVELHPRLPPEALSPEARAAGVHSVLIVPLVARARTLGAMSWARAETATPYDQRDLELALGLATRAAVALDNAQLYRQAEERAQEARVLASVGDGVFLVDRFGLVRTWNQAAATATGLAAASVIDRPAVEAIPGWVDVAAHVPVAPQGTAAVRAESLPLDLGTKELWLSMHGVAVPDGIVYAFRDLTEERALETMRTEFVSTVSHELRTPLAAIYGAAMTLRRSDVALDDEQRARLLDIVSGEADRLARTVNDILWASRLDTDSLHVTISSCDPLALAREIVDAQRAHLDDAHTIALDVADGLQEIAGDPDKVSRVLINLVDNAVKYSPDGGTVQVAIRPHGGRVRFSVADEGLGIPAAEQRRIFEKFYRLDPNMTRGVGGTGLGLYLCRELVRRMDGRIWVESWGLGHGSTFHVELPVAGDFVGHLA